MPVGMSMHQPFLRRRRTEFRQVLCQSDTGATEYDTRVPAARGLALRARSSHSVGRRLAQVRSRDFVDLHQRDAGRTGARAGHLDGVVSLAQYCGDFRVTARGG